MFNDTPDPFALSPLDGRYSHLVHDLKPLGSEWGLMKYRVHIEIQWLIELIAQTELLNTPLKKPLTEIQAKLEKIPLSFTKESALQIRAIEKTTQHDLKAVEYWINAELERDPDLAPLKPWVHFACTSEDINNLAYALMLKDIRDTVLLPTFGLLQEEIQQRAHQYAQIPMLSRTHGQPATPTTLGKEWANTWSRLHRQIEHFSRVSILGKINGAVGNANAHHMAEPSIDWPALFTRVIQKLGLEPNLYTTQIEPHDWMAEYAHALSRINTILLDFARDTWGYISLNYFRQKSDPNAVGSSVMPHKINPIDFENAEGNLGLANALFQHFAEKLPISRWQRDLTDSTVQRNWGLATGHALMAYRAMLKGISKLEPDFDTLKSDLNQHWEVLAEAIQTVMRRYEIPNAYEQLKALTRGQAITAETLKAFIETLALPDAAKQRLRDLTPDTYLGTAISLAQAI